jgi:hypothetical protein
MDEVWYMSGSPFLKSVEGFMRVQRYRHRTIRSYLFGIRYFILQNGKRYPVWLHGTGLQRVARVRVNDKGIGEVASWHATSLPFWG